MNHRPTFLAISIYDDEFVFLVSLVLIQNDTLARLAR
jgi:hypothetical protein